MAWKVMSSSSLPVSAAMLYCTTALERGGESTPGPAWGALGSGLPLSLPPFQQRHTGFRLESGQSLSQLSQPPPAFFLFPSSFSSSSALFLPSHGLSTPPPFLLLLPLLPPSPHCQKASELNSPNNFEKNKKKMLNNMLSQGAYLKARQVESHTCSLLLPFLLRPLPTATPPSFQMERKRGAKGTTDRPNSGVHFLLPPPEKNTLSLPPPPPPPPYAHEREYFLDHQQWGSGETRGGGTHYATATFLFSLPPSSSLLEGKLWDFFSMANHHASGKCLTWRH